MAYELSLQDMQAVQNAGQQPPPPGGYQLSLDDMQDIHKKKSQDEMKSVVMQGLRPQSAKDIPREAENIARGAGAGLLKGAQGIGEFQAKLVRPAANALGIPVAQSMQESVGGQASQNTINQLLGGQQDQNGITQLVTGQQTPKVLQTPEGKIGYAAGQAIPYVGMPMGEGGALVQGLKAAVGSEALAPAFSPEKSLSDAYKDAMAPSALSGLLTATLTGLLHGPKNLGKLMSMGGTATPEEFAANEAAAGNKPVGIGALSNAPTQTFLEQRGLPNIPFTGQAQKNMQVGRMLDNEMRHVKNDLNVVPDDKPRYRINPDTGEAEPVKTMLSTEKVSENIEDNFSENEKIKNQLYGKRDAIAKDLGAEISPDKTEMATVDEIRNIQEELNRKGIANASPEAIKDIKSYGIRATDKEGNPLNQNIPFEKINFELNNLAEKANIAQREGRRNDARIYQRLHSALKQDLKDNMTRLDSAELNQAQAEADKHFREKIAPVLNNEKLKAHAQGYANKSQVIADFVKTKAYEDPEQVNAVLKNLDADHKKQFAHDFLTQGLKEYDGTIEHPSDSMLTMYGKLGDETKRLMFSPHQMKMLDRAFRARKMMGGSINQLINPPTGNNAAKLAGIAAAGASGLAVPAAGYVTSKYLTSPMARSIYRKGAQLREIPGTNLPVSGVALTPALTQALGGNQQ